MLDNTREFHVPEGHYFMMGDNRDDSDDSRASVGFVPLENLVGRAEFIFFSHDGSAAIWEVWKWPTAIRWDRFFHPID
jgi:signal peptidase I